jgi:hypothetical protein
MNLGEMGMLFRFSKTEKTEHAALFLPGPGLIKRARS